MFYLDFKSINKSIKNTLGLEDDPKILYMNNLPENTFLTTDWHLFLKDRNAVIENGDKPVYLRNNAGSILRQYAQLSKDDILFHMGDLVDDEFYLFYNSDQQKAILSEVFDEIKCIKILIRGNNDPLSKTKLFEELGFTVCDAIVYNEFIITHMPIDMTHMPEMYNLHGHNHGHQYYWHVPFHNHYDLWDPDRAPVKLDAEVIINKAKVYSKSVQDIYHLHLPSKAAFIAWRGCEAKNESNY